MYLHARWFHIPAQTLSASWLFGFACCPRGRCIPSGQATAMCELRCTGEEKANQLTERMSPMKANALLSYVGLGSCIPGRKGTICICEWFVIMQNPYGSLWHRCCKNQGER
jgi:hypothetical protein